MYIDTIALYSQPISEWHMGLIRTHTHSTMTIDNATGETIREYTFGQLSGSHDARVGIRFVEHDRTSKLWKIRIEFSLPKLFFGHNVYPGPTLARGARPVIQALYKMSHEIAFPLHNLRWNINRIDIASNWKLADHEQLEAAIRGFRYATYPRRSPSWSQLTGWWCNGSNGGIKFYAKELEYRKHDYKRLYVHAGPRIAKDLALYSFGILRAETEFNHRWFKYHCGNYPDLRDLPYVMLKDKHIAELGKVQRTMHANKRTVTHATDVRLRLNEHCRTANQAATLFTFWTCMVEEGEDYCRSKYTRPTFYRHRRALADAGCSWTRGTIEESKRLKNITHLAFRVVDATYMQEHPAWSEVLNRA
jgi:II/X family phage/plasmid replication protein